MEKYNPINGVPRSSYFLREITQFADFEVSQEERILFTSKNKQELIDLCQKNNWPCPDCGNADSWHTHFIEYRD
jgi:hypothetical protein